MPSLKVTTIRYMAKRSTFARNSNLTYGGETPIEIAFGHRPQDVMTIESMNSVQLAMEPTVDQKTDAFVRDQALRAHLEAR